MKAVILTSINNPLEVHEISLGDIQIGQVLVRNLTSGLCGAQLQEISGNKGNAGLVPHLLGHEGCGFVEAIGEGVTKVKPGDKVILHWRKGSGLEGGFPSYTYEGNKVSGGKVTTLSEFSIVSENRITKIPDETDPEIAAMLGCSLSTALGVVENEIDFKLGQNVLVIGMGGVGQNLVVSLRFIGCNSPHVFDKSESKKQHATKLGAGKFTSNLQDLDSQYDLIIDTTGNAEIFDWATAKLSSTGKLVLIGQPDPSLPLSISAPYGLFLGEGKTIKTTQGGKFNPDSDIPRYIKFLEEIGFNASQVVTNRYKLDDINIAVDALRTGETGKIIFEIGTK
jgi:Zn-dependent alcohol dehydrogenase